MDARAHGNFGDSSMRLIRSQYRGEHKLDNRYGNARSTKDQLGPLGERFPLNNLDNSVKPVNHSGMLTLVSSNQKGMNMEIPSQGLMRCSACGLDKPLSEMTAVAVKKNRKWKRCKACENAYALKWRDLNRPKFNEYHRDWRMKQGARLNERNVQLRKIKISKMTPEEIAIFRKFESDKAKWFADTLKDEVFMAYGGWKCACCAETEKSFLTIDHMLNNGSKLRREGVHGHSSEFYRWLKKSGYPKEFQVLCMNCNFGKRMNGGICPHKQGVTTRVQTRRDECPEAPRFLRRNMR